MAGNPYPRRRPSPCRRFGALLRFRRCDMVRIRMKSLLPAAVAIGVALAQTVCAATNPEREDPRIQQAVDAYAAKLKADQERARDQLVASNEAALLNDPHTPVIGDSHAGVAIVEFFD